MFYRVSSFLDSQETSCLLYILDIFMSSPPKKSGQNTWSIDKERVKF